MLNRIYVKTQPQLHQSTKQLNTYQHYYPNKRITNKENPKAQRPKTQHLTPNTQKQ
jgi:hypothetical protein